MPVIVFASSKGGAGKTTTALVLSQVLAEGGSAVTLIDADPNQALATWASRTEVTPAGIKLVPRVTEATIIDHIDEAARRDPFVIVDLEGTPNVSVTYAIGRADLVVIPMQGSQFDADQTSRIIGVIQQQVKAFRRSIPYVVVYTLTTALRPRDFKHIDRELKAAGVPVLAAEMTQRAAFRAIAQLGGTIYQLTAADVSNPAAAIENAEAVARAIVDQLRTQRETAA
jgi:chromosome partitioning protein